MRRGTTLIEVLIAIFIMALGLIALLTLFPIGAVQMARAIQDERAAQVAANSAAYFRWYWKSLSENEQARIASLPSASATQMFPCDANCAYQAAWFTGGMDDPNIGVPSGLQKASTYFPTPLPTTSAIAFANVASRSRSNGPSFPVLIDPVGWEGARISGDPVIQHWVGASAPSGIDYAMPRRTLMMFSDMNPNVTLKKMSGPFNDPVTMSARPQMATRMCYLLDDMTFYRNGTVVDPDNPPPAAPGKPPTVNRPWKDSSYSCAFLIKRENNSDRGRINLSVVVYAKKSIDATPNEPAYLGQPQVGIIPADVAAQRPATVAWGNTVTLTYGASQEAPPVRRGTWILDSTVHFDNTTPTTYDTTGRGVVTQGYFYRVTEVLERTPPSATNPMGTVVVQMETNLKPGRIDPATNIPFPRLFVIPDGILEVFDKGPIDPTSPPRVN